MTVTRTRVITAESKEGSSFRRCFSYELAGFAERLRMGVIITEASMRVPNFRLEYLGG